MLNDLPSRFLMLDIRAQRYGFAAFDASRRLLGWGYRRNACAGKMTVEKHLTILQLRFGFGQILVRRRTDVRSQQQQRDVVDAVVRFGSSAKVPITLIDAHQIRSFFNGRSKYEIAKLVAERFPEIAWKLPRKRKVWQPESERQSIFDAMSVGMYFFGSQS